MKLAGKSGCFKGAHQTMQSQLASPKNTTTNFPADTPGCPMHRSMYRDAWDVKTPPQPQSSCR